MTRAPQSPSQMPSPHFRWLSLLPLIPLLLVTMAVGPCETHPLGSLDGGLAGCDYGGTHRRAGSSFPSIDGCNTCSCQSDGQVACTLRACVNDGGASTDGAFTCIDASGVVHLEGVDFLSADGCNICSCANGQVACTDRACGNDGGGATDGRARDGGGAVDAPSVCIDASGVVYREGAQIPSGDACNTCMCVNGQVACTTRACPSCVRPDGTRLPAGTPVPSPDGCSLCTCDGNGVVACSSIQCPLRDGGVAVDAQGGGCSYQGFHDVGSTFTAIDGCNTCTCLANGQVACTASSACPSRDAGGGVCTPGADWTCNDDPTINVIVGACRDGICLCPRGTNPLTGKCL